MPRPRSPLSKTPGLDTLTARVEEIFARIDKYEKRVTDAEAKVSSLQDTRAGHSHGKGRQDICDDDYDKRVTDAEAKVSSFEDTRAGHSHVRVEEISVMMIMTRDSVMLRPRSPLSKTPGLDTLMARVEEIFARIDKYEKRVTDAEAKVSSFEDTRAGHSHGKGRRDICQDR
ncbi:hypothetical protein NDU88_007988 [Pleurodeles waltl]|uniref:Uncharacterized protein n=1 Tax=Pleurodeles waltl TaxID=8319 RepID=A0AAV7U2S8_PLEWA|nr:hypothetical protein NDU88_007988 [Pleurodeles waltl]